MPMPMVIPDPINKMYKFIPFINQLTDKKISFLSIKPSLKPGVFIGNLTSIRCKFPLLKAALILYTNIFEQSNVLFAYYFVTSKHSSNNEGENLCSLRHD